MTASQRFHLQIAPLAAAVVGLAAVNWSLHPERARGWMAAIACMAAVWLISGGIQHARQSEASRRFMAISAIMAALMLAVSLATSLGAALGVITYDVSSRLAGVLTGLFLAVVGNQMPKAVGPIVARRCTAAMLQGINRFGGWAFAIAGLAVAAAWILLPPGKAPPATMLLVGGATLLMVGRILWAAARA